MPEPEKNNLLEKSKIAVGVVVAVLLVLGVIQVAQGFIDTHNYRDEFIKIVKEKTGRDITINGKVSFSLLPTPTIYIPNVELRDTETENPIPTVTIDMIRLDVPLLAVFSDRPRVSAITLSRPVLEVERAKDNFIHWDWLNTALLKALNEDNAALDITEGKIIYHDSRTDKGMTLENFHASVTSGSHLSVKASFTSYGHDLKFNLAADGTASAMPFTAKLYADDKNALEWQGDLDMSGDIPKITAKFHLALENVLTWTAEKTEETKQLLGQIAAPGAQEEKNTPLPLTLSGDWSEEGLAINLVNVELQGLNSAGKGKFALTWEDWVPSITSVMDFQTLDYTRWQTFFTAAFLDKTPPAPTSAGEQVNNPIPKDMRADFTITADQLSVGPATWKKATLSAILAEAEVTVNRFSIELPGESTLTLFGIISQGATGGVRFEGSMETAGKSLRGALTIFNEAAVDIPDIGFGTFYARSNIFVSSEQVRLSEADVKINDLGLNGGLVAYFDVHPRLEADVRLKDINFDYFRNAWRKKQTAAGQHDFFLKFDKSMNFNWLKKLQTSIDFKVNVDGFTFMERKGNNAAFRIFAKPDEFGLYDIRLTYPEETMEGNFNLDVKGSQPLISVIVNASAINTDYFAGAAEDSATPVPLSAAESWREKLIDTSWMAGYSGEFDISIGRLTTGKTIVDRLKLQAKLDNNLLTFQNFTFNYWQGRCSVLGSMYGGEVPGVSLSFTLYNIELHDMLKELTGRDNITGGVSISGTLTTSGVNFSSWISQADTKLIVAGRGVNVTGLNMQGVVDAVTVSRTAADVFNNVNLALSNGASELTVDGTINVANGIMKTPGITLKTGAIIGDLTGEVRLIPWTMGLSTLFQFPSLTSETVPTMTVQLSGPIDAPELKTDTASLEAYVTKRIISR